MRKQGNGTARVAQAVVFSESWRRFRSAR